MTHPIARNSGMPDPEFSKRVSEVMDDTSSILPISGTRDLPVEVNSEGGMQSSTLGRFDLIPGESLVSLARVYGEGAKKYEENNWHKISEEDHINHALEHLAMYEMGRTDEPHLDHALCRLSMAVWARHNRKEDLEKRRALEVQQLELHRQKEWLNGYQNSLPGPNSGIKTVESGPITFTRLEGTGPLV